MNKTEEILAVLLEKEWIMFHAVNGDGPKADCQERKDVFQAMRRAQFLSWSEEAVLSYFKDIESAEKENRNLVLEKYVYMMKSTTPDQYPKVAHLIKEPDDEKKELIDKINHEMIEDTIALYDKYPYIASTGRPIYSKEDDAENTSLETYQAGEFFTYSIDTLKAIEKYMKDLKEKQTSLAEKILENTVRSYGFHSLEEAEENEKARVGHGIQIGFSTCPLC